MRVLLALLAACFGSVAGAAEITEFKHVSLAAIKASSPPGPSSGVIGELRECEAGRSDWPPCGHIYSGGEAGLLVELCKSTSSFEPGLYLIGSASEVWFYPWFDAQLMEFSCSERSEDGEETGYYGVGPHSETGFQAMLYRYEINLSSGHVYFLLLPASRTRVLDAYNWDSPS